MITELSIPHSTQEPHSKTILTIFCILDAFLKQPTFASLHILPENPAFCIAYFPEFLHKMAPLAPVH